jgi:NADH:ubiquinone oxidoreductase subunit D
MNLPADAKVNKIIPKNTFYAKFSISNKLKNEFIEKIKKIIWLYKISEKTLNIEKTEQVEEIQVFEIELKSKEIPKNVLKLIDKTIPYPILFIFKFKEQIAYGISLKHGGVLENYYFSSWNEKIEFDFIATNLEKVYQKIIKKFIKNLDTTNKKFSEIIEKNAIIEKTEKEIGILRKKMKNEKQFNKQILLNKELKTKQEKLKNLKNN